jgi:hypothetical protein
VANENDSGYVLWRDGVLCCTLKTCGGLIGNLIASSSSGKLFRVDLEIVISSFSREIDDAFRNVNDSRQLIVLNSAHGVIAARAALVNLGICEKISLEESSIATKSPPRREDSQEAAGDRQASDETELQQSVSAPKVVPAQNYVLDSVCLKSIARSLWALVALLLLFLFGCGRC